MSNMKDWEVVWQELKTSLLKQPKCPNHPECPHVTTLSKKVINDIINVKKEEGVTIRSHRTMNERFIEEDRFRTWWNHLNTKESASLIPDDPNTPDYRDSAIVGAIMAACLSDRIEVVNSTTIRLIQNKNKRVLESIGEVKREKAGENSKENVIPRIPDEDLEKQKDFLLAEYNALRKEIMRRYSTRTAVLIMTNTIIGLVLGYSIKESAYYGFLVLSFVVPVFGMIDLYCSYQINKIGNYIAERLENSISGFYWETYVREQRRTKKKNPYYYKFTFRIPAILLFVVLPLLLLASYQFFFSEFSLIEIFLSILVLFLILWVLVGFLSLEKWKREYFFSY